MEDEKAIPTDEELDAAAAQEETVEIEETVPPEDEGTGDESEQPEPKGEENPQEPSEEDVPDHQEKSRLGRRLKRMEAQFSTLMQRLEGLQSTPAVTEKEEDLPDQDEFVRASDIPKIMERLTEKKQAEQSKYENDYLYATVSLGADENISTELQDAIFDKMQSEFNTRITGNPKVDAELNYRKAMTSVLAKQASTPKNPLKGGKPNEAIGVGAPTQTPSAPASKKVKLDPYAAEFAKSVGMTEEEVSAALSSSNTSTVLRK